MTYEKIKYPDGQVSCKITSLSNNTINIRLSSYEDLFFLEALTDAIYKKYSINRGKLELFIPCMLGQRSDRRFADNQSFDLKLICDFINKLDFQKVTVFDPHSDVTLALLNYSEKLSSFQYVKQAVEQMKGCTAFKQPLVLVSPDAGAYKKVFEYGEKLGLEVVAAVKHRDLNGNVDLTFMGDVKDKECLIVDDLCDGGYTFKILGKKLKEQGATWVSLYVSHGYFSKGFEELNQVIDHIYCTNSVKDIGDFQHTGEKLVKTNVTQFKLI